MADKLHHPQPCYCLPCKAMRSSGKDIIQPSDEEESTEIKGISRKRKGRSK